MDYKLHLRITTVGSPNSGQPHAGGYGAGEALVDQVIDLRQWVAERMAIDPVEPAQPVAPIVADAKTPGTPPGPSPVNAPASKPALPPAPVGPVLDEDDAPDGGRSSFDPSRSNV